MQSFNALSASSMHRSILKMLRGLKRRVEIEEGRSRPAAEGRRPSGPELAHLQGLRPTERPEEGAGRATDRTLERPQKAGRGTFICLRPNPPRDAGSGRRRGGERPRCLRRPKL